MPTWFLAPIAGLKLPAQYNNPMPTRFLAPIDCSKIPALFGGVGRRIPEDRDVNSVRYEFNKVCGSESGSKKAKINHSKWGKREA